MKKIKILIPLLTVSTLATTVAPLASCGTKETNKVIPTNLLKIKDGRLLGFVDNADISTYNTLDVPSNVKIIEDNAFNSSNVDYSKITTLNIPNGIAIIGKQAFASLTKIETIDFSKLDHDTVNQLQVNGDNIFGSVNQNRYAYVALPEKTEQSRKTLVEKLTNAGAPEFWFVQKTDGNVKSIEGKQTIQTPMADTKAVFPLELTRSLIGDEQIHILLEKTGGTTNVDVSCISVEVNNRSISMKVNMVEALTNALKDGDKVEFKTTVICANQTKTPAVQWVQTIDGLCVVYQALRIIHVNEIRLDKSFVIHGTAQGTFTINKTIYPSSATYKDVKWESSNQAAATVDQEGVVTPVAQGEATITCTSLDPDVQISASCRVAIVEGTYIPAESITLTPVEDKTKQCMLPTCINGQTLTIKSAVTPANASFASNITWKSSNENLATVSNGTVTINSNAAGDKTQPQVTITATVNDPYVATPITASYTIDIIKAQFINDSPTNVAYWADFGWETLANHYRPRPKTKVQPYIKDREGNKAKYSFVGYGFANVSLGGGWKYFIVVDEDCDELADGSGKKAALTYQVHATYENAKSAWGSGNNENYLNSTLRTNCNNYIINNLCIKDTSTKIPTKKVIKHVSVKKDGAWEIAPYETNGFAFTRTEINRDSGLGYEEGNRYLYHQIYTDNKGTATFDNTVNLSESNSEIGFLATPNRDSTNQAYFMWNNKNISGLAVSNGSYDGVLLGFCL